MGRLLSLYPEKNNETGDSVNLAEDSIIYDLMTFILRYYEGIEYTDFGLDEFLVSKLKAEEIKRLWLTIDMLVGKFEESRGKFKSRNVSSIFL